MKRLDQGHLHPKLEVQDWHVPAGNRTLASTPEKSHTNSLLTAIQNIYIWARDQWIMLATVLSIIRGSDQFWCCVVCWGMSADPRGAHPRVSHPPGPGLLPHWGDGGEGRRGASPPAHLGQVSHTDQLGYVFDLDFQHVLWIGNYYFGSGSDLEKVSDPDSNPDLDNNKNLNKN